MTTPSVSLPALAAAARDLAATATPGSLERKGAGCAAVALTTCRSLASARQALAGVRDPAVRAAALDLIGRLAAEHEGAPQ